MASILVVDGYLDGCEMLVRLSDIAFRSACGCSSASISTVQSHLPSTFK